MKGTERSKGKQLERERKREEIDNEGKVSNKLAYRKNPKIQKGI